MKVTSILILDQNSMWTFRKACSRVAQLENSYKACPDWKTAKLEKKELVFLVKHNSWKYCVVQNKEQITQTTLRAKARNITPWINLNGPVHTTRKIDTNLNYVLCCRQKVANPLSSLCRVVKKKVCPQQSEFVGTLVEDVGVDQTNGDYLFWEEKKHFE